MSNKLVTRLRNKDPVSQDDENVTKKEAANEIERLEEELDRLRGALEQIGDQAFEHTNSTRLTDQLWHFVRWAKSIAREALESSGSAQGVKGKNE